MPTYQYACTECGHRFEAVQSFHEDALTALPECDGRLRKVFNAVGVVFKGSGFYRTDSRAARPPRPSRSPTVLVGEVRRALVGEVVRLLGGEVLRLLVREVLRLLVERVVLGYVVLGGSGSGRPARRQRPPDPVESRRADPASA